MLHMLQTLRHRLATRLAAWPWRRVGLLAGISFGLALLLVLYLFGVSDHFFSRLFSAILVFFWLLALTSFAIVPFITWATGHWFGRRWQAAPQPAPRPRRPAAGHSSARS